MFDEDEESGAGVVELGMVARAGCVEQGALWMGIGNCADGKGR